MRSAIRAVRAAGCRGTRRDSPVESAASSSGARDSGGRHRGALPCAGEWPSPFSPGAAVTGASERWRDGRPARSGEGEGGAGAVRPHRLTTERLDADRGTAAPARSLRARRDRRRRAARPLDLRAQSTHRRHRRRRARLRPARATARGPDRQRDHGESLRPALRRAQRPAVETSHRFTGEPQLRRVIERIVARVGRRIDESSPLVDARLEDGSRVNAIIPPLAVERLVAHDPKVRGHAVHGRRPDRLRLAHARGCDSARCGGAGEDEHPRLRWHGYGQDHVAQRALGLHSE